MREQRMSGLVVTTADLEKATRQGDGGWRATRDATATSKAGRGPEAGREVWLRTTKRHAGSGAVKGNDGGEGPRGWMGDDWSLALPDVAVRRAIFKAEGPVKQRWSNETRAGAQ
ncbi:uncharacterized protein BDR25DRAFT_54574 [Lindgomyces ingoldianus]|uniref:Uncharacterized protein n=1 Tax=Lindgomyces ingoldianus TaxID=673940 RepID=A0ACB6QQ12_9PLEO|nr:uncharacterized protein BDR25DRAFT_54574 [Lindgomyces ingoldianus]KAF2468975.1 hypothetical protein BDR25DRAFT_54574 [Lindgomyces ingoldianus]